MAGLDQFYTQPHIAKKCWDVLNSTVDTSLSRFIEPSAGTGVFYDLLPEGSIGIDIDPQHADLVEADFLGWEPDKNDPSNTVIVGNPPFGSRGRLAVRFFNHAAVMADTVAFIVPVIFAKYFIHKQLPADWHLVRSEHLPRESFTTGKHPSYSVNTVFQVWTAKDTQWPDLRQFAPPPRHHPDFDFWQYNNTKQALKVFDNPFDFAVPCQGWQDYTRRETDEKQCERHKQWMLFKARTRSVYERLINFDFKTLAHKYVTSTPGYRKGDFITEYLTLYG